MIGGVPLDEANQLASTIGIPYSEPHLTYQGVPIITTRMKKSDCLPLVERITSKMKDWKARYLSQAGRFTLVQAVLFAMQVYWSRIFMLPTSILDTIANACNKFLWKGPEMNKKVNPCSWKILYLPKLEGGVGLINLRAWNAAANMQHLFRLAQEEESFLWVRWMHNNRLKKKNLWTMAIPQDSSWVWRAILSRRTEGVKYVRYLIHKGDKAKFWHDPWSDQGILFNKLSHQQRVDTGIPNTALVKRYIRNGQVHLPRTGDLQVSNL